MRYLQEKPDAGDTLEGISSFWLEFERIDQAVDEVSDALESLVKQGLVNKIESKGITTVYKRAGILEVTETNNV